MNPLLASAAFGLLKALAARQRGGATLPNVHWLHHSLAGPLYEEAVYRMVPHLMAGERLPPGVTAFHFAADHIAGEARNRPLGRWAAARFADVFFGGLLYERAYRRWGYLGAVACHAVHNLACSLGAAKR